MEGFLNKFFIQLDERKIDFFKQKILHTIERELNVKISVKQNIVEINSIPGKTLPTDFLKAVSIVKAISYGFTIEVALKLLNDKFKLEIVDLRSIIKRKEDLKRVKGRIIGERGKVKKNIEEIARCNIVISNDTVAIIGELEKIFQIREAIEKIIKGSRYKSVYNYLRRTISYL